MRQTYSTNFANKTGLFVYLLATRFMFFWCNIWPTFRRLCRHATMRWNIFWKSILISVLIDQGFRIYIHANNGARADMPWAFFISPIYDYVQHSLRAVMPGNQTWVMTVSNVRHYTANFPLIKSTGNPRVAKCTL